MAANRTTQAPWLDGFLNGACYPYLSSPYEAGDVRRLQDSFAARLALVSSDPFVPAVMGAHLSDTPTKASKDSMQRVLLQVIREDWQGTQVRLVHVTRGDAVHGLVSVGNHMLHTRFGSFDDLSCQCRRWRPAHSSQHPEPCWLNAHAGHRSCRKFGADLLQSCIVLVQCAGSSSCTALHRV